MFLKKHSQPEWTPADRQRERLLLDYFAAETNLEEKAKAAISALRAKRVQKVNDLYDEDGKEIYEENRESSTMFTLDEAIQHCYEIVERLRKSNPCDTCTTEHEQLAHWLEELKKLRVECDGLRSNWYKCAEKVKTLRAERDAAVSDLRKLVPAWKWDGEKEQSSHKEAPECGCVEFG